MALANSYTLLQKLRLLKAPICLRAEPTSKPLVSVSSCNLNNLRPFEWLELPGSSQVALGLGAGTVDATE
jgi:hypothetical protein